ncbi:hypothetical protein C1645_743175 [Glomus cerebriforme]|uniref:Uncharacterized protein n=1 Tax=Glomus cerebriforme TaxID=658196 RepID=A0A397SAE1_9GLOM|nr:hypothetical protein C1645_743175 [Glomus cerebriforme]
MQLTKVSSYTSACHHCFDGLQSDITSFNCGSDFGKKFQTRLKDNLICFCVKYGLEFLSSSSENAIVLFDHVVALAEILKVLGQNDKFYLLLMQLIEGPVLFTLFTSFAIDEEFYAKIPNKVAYIVFVE